MKFISMRRALAVALIACAAVAGSSAPAHAITITVNSITKLGGDTANFVQNNSTNAGEWQSQVSTLNGGTSTPDLLGATVTGATRYASVLGSDAQAANFGSRGDSATSNYQMIFTVTPDNLSNEYSVSIDTARRGALVNRDEGGAAGTETIGAVTGTISGGGIGIANLPALPTQNSNSTVVTHINQTSTTATFSGLTGVQVFTLTFQWTQSTNSGNNILSGGDEAVVLLGLGSGLTSTASSIGAADDYPGTSGRTASNDGHFINVSATITQIVPEPSSILLALCGGVGVAIAAWRRRRAA